MGKSVPITLGCSQQPLHVEHHRSFIMDTQVLKSIDDIKCDDVGSWVHNSNKKFKFVVGGGSKGLR